MRSPTRALLHLLSLPRPHTPVHARLRAHKLTPPGQVGVRADFSSKAGAFIAKATQPIEAGTELLFWYGNMCYERWINSKPEEPHPALAPHHSIAPLSTLWSEWSALRPPPAPRAAHRVVWACDPRICDPCIYMRPIYVRPMRATHAYVTQPTSRSPRGMGTGPSLTLHTPVSSHARLFTHPSRWSQCTASRRPATAARHAATGRRPCGIDPSRGAIRQGRRADEEEGFAKRDSLLSPQGGIRRRANAPSH